METTARPAPSRRGVLAASALLVLAIAAGALLVTVSYGLTVEYGDTSAPAGRTALGAYRDFGLGIVVPAVLVAGAVLAGRGSRAVRGAGAAVLVATLVGVPVGAVLGVEEKYDRFPAVPNCTSELSSGPAVPVVRSAQAAFEELEHPAPFSGGGSSGIDGCSSDLMVRDQMDPRARYRTQLRHRGWTVVSDSRGELAAERRGQRFELTRSTGGWTVWVGPAGVRQRSLAEGMVGPRR